MAMSDEGVQQAVVEELDWDPSVNSAHIGVTAPVTVTTAPTRSSCGPQKFGPALEGVRCYEYGLIRERSAPSLLSERITNELWVKLGRQISPRTVHPTSGQAGQGWTFRPGVSLNNPRNWRPHASAVAASFPHVQSSVYASSAGQAFDEHLRQAGNEVAHGGETRNDVQI